MGVILAGGASSRFGGRPKGLELLGGHRIVDRVRNALIPHVSGIFLSANHRESPTWLHDVTIVTDNYTSAGGLAGVEAALRSAGRSIIVVAWDMPFVSGAIIKALIDRAQVSGASVVVPASRSPHGIEPFCAHYSPAVLPRLHRALEDGRVAAHAFLRGLDDLDVITPPDVDPDVAFLSVNTDDDLARARRIVGAE